MPQAESKYFDLNYVRPVTILTESTFNLCTQLLNRNNNKMMSPKVFEALLFLKINRRFWDINTVQQAMTMPDPDLAEWIDVADEP